jgi:Cu(I)/Ag(I) efflux system membrane fusion protein
MTSRAFLLGTVLLAAGVGGGVLLERHLLAAPGASTAAATAPIAPAPGSKKILYWWDPMMPAYKSDKPGKSPMGMDMVPVYEGGEPGGSAEPGVVTVSPAVVNNLGVRTAVVERTSLTPAVETFGSVSFDESRVSHVHVRARGWIERLQARVEGETVKSGHVLFEFFSPDVVNAASEYLRELNRRPDGGGIPDGVDIIRRKLMSLGMADRQIEEIRRTRQVPDRIQVFAPRSGVVTRLGVAEGMFVEPTMTLMSIVDHDVLWIFAEVVESQGGLVMPGMTIEARTPSQPGRVWTGTVDYVYPELRPETRTVRLRIRVENPDHALRHGMFASVRIVAPPRDSVPAIPSEALIRVGAGARVVLALGDGRFKPVPVRAGLAVGEKVEVLEGLKEGDRVVASAQFLLDSESRLSAGLARLDAPDAGVAKAGPIWTEATINSPPSPDRMVNLSHPPIAEIGWPAMTMYFAIDPAVPAGEFAAGRHRRVGLAKSPDGTYRIVAVEPSHSGGAR